MRTAEPTSRARMPNRKESSCCPSVANGARSRAENATRNEFLISLAACGVPNALVQLQAQYNHCGEAASEKCLSAATFVSWPREEPSLLLPSGRPGGLSAPPNQIETGG